MTTPEVTTQRPAWVPADFAGRCKVFPVRDTLLLGYQRRWVMDPSQRRLGEKSRQIGWTWATAYDTVRTLGQERGRENQWDAWITSRDAEQAQLTVVDMSEWAALLNIGAKDLGERVVDDKGATTQQLRFANGLIAHSMSSNFNAQAGKRGHRILDEFGLHDQQRQLFAIAEPGTTWGGRLSIFSTHRGTGTFFNTLVREVREKGNPKRFSLHTVTLQDALDGGFLFKLQSKLPASHEAQAMDEAEYFDYKRAGAADEESFLQEYMCVPSDDSTAFVGYDLLDLNRMPDPAEWSLDLDALATCGPLYAGIDIGRSHDLTVLWIVEKTGPVAVTRRVIELRDVAFSLQEATIYPYLALPNLRRVCIDETGIGRQFAERAQERHGRHRVEPVTFTGPVKEELAYPLRGALEDGNFRLPDDPAIFADFRAIKKMQTAAGNVRFAADRGKNGHADRFWAAALALHAGKTAAGPAWAENLGRRDLFAAAAANDGRLRPDHSDDLAATQEWGY